MRAAGPGSSRRRTAGSWNEVRVRRGRGKRLRLCRSCPSSRAPLVCPVAAERLWHDDVDELSGVAPSFCASPGGAGTGLVLVVDGEDGEMLDAGEHREMLDGAGRAERPDGTPAGRAHRQCG